MEWIPLLYVPYENQIFLNFILLHSDAYMCKHPPQSNYTQRFISYKE